jgi:4'-phosphopantetheinyl transferase
MPYTASFRSMPTSGEIMVWWWRLDTDVATIQELRTLLSAAEIVQADRFVQASDGARYTVAHGRLRQIIASYTGLNAESLRFLHTDAGKPFLPLECMPSAADLRFNLSHSSDVAVLAVANGVDVGADIEQVRAVDSAVVACFFDPDEQRDLAQLPAENWLRGFYRCWTRKEAVLKASGYGLNAPLDSFSVTVSRGDRAWVRRASGPLVGATKWSLLSFSVATEMIGAIAVVSDREHRICDILEFTGE